MPGYCMLFTSSVRLAIRLSVRLVIGYVLVFMRRSVVSHCHSATTSNQSSILAERHLFVGGRRQQEDGWCDETEDDRRCDEEMRRECRPALQQHPKVDVNVRIRTACVVGAVAPSLAFHHTPFAHPNYPQIRLIPRCRQVHLSMQFSRLLLLLLSFFSLASHKATGFKHCAKQGMTATASNRSQKC